VPLNVELLVRQRPLQPQRFFPSLQPFAATIIIPLATFDYAAVPEAMISTNRAFVPRARSPPHRDGTEAFSAIAARYQSSARPSPASKK
jgi:hypothetical protein